MANLGTDGSAGPLTASSSPATVSLVAGAGAGAWFMVQADGANSVPFQFSVNTVQEQPAGVVNDYVSVPAGTGVPFFLNAATGTLTYKSASSTPTAYVSRVKVGR